MASIDDDLRTALQAALPDLTEDQAHAARTLVDALAPPMDDEPKWPGAPVIAACNNDSGRRLHVRRNDGLCSGWECQYSCDCIEWDRLINPRPLTPAEHEKYGIPMPCTHAAQDKQGEATKPKPLCYIAGPIAGVPDFRERFAAAVPAVEALGYEVVNPCDITPADHEGECPPGYDPGGDAGGHASSACFVRADLRALLDCDAIFMLPGWSRSRGATVEHAVAVACGIPVLEKEGNPNEHHR